MEKVNATGRELFTTNVNGYVINHTKTTTSSNVYVTSIISMGEERIGSASYNKDNDHFTLGIRSWADIAEKDRTLLAQTIINDYNELLR